MKLNVLRSERHILTQRTIIVLHATIQHLHHLEVRLNAVVNVDAASNNRHRLFDYDRQLRREKEVRKSVERHKRVACREIGTEILCCNTLSIS